MSGEEQKLTLARRRMIDDQLRSRGIVHQPVLSAFQQVPRHRFVPLERISEAYADHPVPIGCGQTISQPLVVAMMLQELDAQPHHKVLDVGAGSGYQTALLSALARHVYAIERIDELADKAMSVFSMLDIDNVTLETGDGTLGWPEEAPFDRIICGAGAPEVPSPWIDQLADGGRIVLPVGDVSAQNLVVVEKKSGHVIERTGANVCFVKLIGQEGWPA